MAAAEPVAHRALLADLCRPAVKDWRLPGFGRSVDRSGPQDGARLLARDPLGGGGPQVRLLG
ncbi:MAG TPA: hypothetical protein VN520_34840, partial [Streptomyces sp.]|uniref:hypothetical protein n=1 Tax=Streptomyces sp. TaxID=1931 RepID=UPI002C04467B